MHALDLRAPAPSFARARAKTDLTEQRLRAFRPELRAAVMALARTHPRLADLAASFPALLVALAHPRKGFDPAPVIAAVVEGRPLGELAWLCGVPLWLRNFKPAMFAGPIPELPDTALFRRMIVNHLPRSPRHAQRWLDTVAAAARDGTEPFAIWCARHLAQKPDRELIKRLRLLSLWAWYSSECATHGHALIETVWHPSMAVKTAIAHADRWVVEIELHLDFAGREIEALWLEPAVVDGYEFLPLRTEAGIRAEAIAMRNCLRIRGYDVVHDRERLWSIRADGRRVATVSVGRLRRQPILAITELKAIGNKTAPLEVWFAAQRWLFTCGPDLAELAQIKERDAPLSRMGWRKLWKPYWMAKGHFPVWLPLAPSRGAIGSL